MKKIKGLQAPHGATSVGILGTRHVKIGVVGAYSPFANGLFDHDNVCKPGRVPDFNDEISFEELVHFLSNRFASFFSVLLLLL